MDVHMVMALAVSSLPSVDRSDEGRDGAGVGGTVSSANVTFLSIRDFQPRPLARPGQSQLADWSNTATAEPSL